MHIWNPAAQILNHRVRLFKATGMAVNQGLGYRHPSVLMAFMWSSSPIFMVHQTYTKILILLIKFKAGRYFHDGARSGKGRSKIM